MGHSCQAISVLVGCGTYVAAIPLVTRIHEGIVTSNRWKHSLLDKLFTLIVSLQIAVPYYLVADAYYASGKLIHSFLQAGNHLISRVRNNAVAFEIAPPPSKHKRGRPKLYGKKIRLCSVFKDLSLFTTITSPIYGEHKQQISYRSLDLLWRPAQRVIRFVFVSHPCAETLSL